MKIVRVTAIWCMSCLAMKRVWRKVFAEYPELEIIDLDFDFDKDALEKFHIGKTLPELIIFKGESEIGRIIGEKSKKQMFDLLDEIYEKI